MTGRAQTDGAVIARPDESSPDRATEGEAA
jgi:hypothetical protein